MVVHHKSSAITPDTPVEAGDLRPDEARQAGLVETGLEFSRRLRDRAGSRRRKADKEFRDSLYEND